MAQEKQLIWLISGGTEQRDALVDVLQSHETFRECEIQYAPRFTPQLQREFKRVVSVNSLVGACINIDGRGISDKKIIWAAAKSIYRNDIPIVCYTMVHYNTSDMSMFHTRFPEIEDKEVPYIIWSEHEEPAKIIVQELDNMINKMQSEEDSGIFKSLIKIFKRF